MRAAEAETVGIVLHRAFHRAFSAAKKVREQDPYRPRGGVNQLGGDQPRQANLRLL